ncbi:MAG TPA: glutathione-disulfide reductase [Bauldia sp.]|nr:glutathione-disulfide reductase [Bauldia sp.]
MSRFDYDLFVIGGGSGGVRAARVAAGHGARVALAEENKVGGTCVLRGCVPKKLFAHAAHFSEALEDSVGFGWRTEGVSFDWPTLVRNVTADTEWLSTVYIRNLQKSGVEIHNTRAVIEDANHVRLVADGRVVSTRFILVATGGSPKIDAGVAGVDHTIVSDDVFRMARLPKRILIVGAGFVGIEFAGIFSALGVETTVLYRGAEILRGFDHDVRKAVHAGMEARGVTIITGDHLAAVEKSPAGLVGVTRTGRRLDADAVLMAIGRTPNVLGFGLTEAGAALDGRGAVVVDPFSQTTVPGIYAVGDVTNRLCLTPVAIREGEAVADTLFGGRAVALDYTYVPEAVFSTPEVGSVGLTEDAAKGRFPALDIYRTSFKPLPNRVAGREDRMMMKLVVDGTTDRVLGCHIVGPNASELIQMVAIAVRMGATKADFDQTVALHPTMAEELVTMRKPAEQFRRQAAE